MEHDQQKHSKIFVDTDKINGKREIPKIVINALKVYKEKELYPITSYILRILNTVKYWWHLGQWNKIYGTKYMLKRLVKGGNTFI